MLAKAFYEQNILCCKTYRLQIANNYVHHHKPCHFTGFSAVIGSAAVGCAVDVLIKFTLVMSY